MRSASRRDPPLMATQPPARPEPYQPHTRRLIRPPVGVIDWKDSRWRFALQLPRLSVSGAAAIVAHVNEACPPVWHDDFADKRVLVMGTGPSLDRAHADLFASYDAVLHINFALRRADLGSRPYFFTTDLGPVREYMDAHGLDDFVRLGPARCIYAPVFFDHWHYLTEGGRAMFTMLRPDESYWRFQSVKAGPVRLPLLMRRYPVQPDWSTFSLPAPGRTLPILEHSSALTAVVFAAMQGAREIGLIGCDFSSGRASGVADGQSAVGAGSFDKAAGVLRGISAMLARHGIACTNHSWEV